MNGDFKGDFTRNTFNPLKGFSRVLIQQGRVQLDADWNEQTDILLHYIRRLATAIIGPHGGPATCVSQDGTTEPNKGFAVNPLNDAKTLTIGIDEYYVDGILVDNRPVDEEGQEIKAYTYNDHPDYLRQPYYQPISLKNEDHQFFPNGYNLLYLDVWEQQISYLEDESIREVALGKGRPDTATRARVVWQVRAMNAEKYKQDLSEGGHDLAYISKENSECIAKLLEYSPQNAEDNFNIEKTSKLYLKRSETQQAIYGICCQRGAVAN